MKSSVAVLSAPIHHLKRQAKAMARDQRIPLHAALDRMAWREGHASWSLLASRWAAARPAARIFERLHPGDLVLLGARRGQGKTLLGVELIVEAARRGGRGRFFSLEETAGDFIAHLRAVGETAWPDGTDRIRFDDSDDVGAPYVIDRLADEPAGTIVVIDYLQILDQRRDKPDLSTQVAALRAFAKARGLIIVCLSQIDRRYDSSAKPLPDRNDVRLPNPLDLALFDRTCFLHAGRLRLA
ncbi:MAG: DNA helicase [Burkholderiaceae bacterium]